jgi:hypothetical protein
VWGKRLAVFLPSTSPGVFNVSRVSSIEGVIHEMAARLRASRAARNSTRRWKMATSIAPPAVVIRVEFEAAAPVVTADYTTEAEAAHLCSWLNHQPE